MYRRYDFEWVLYNRGHPPDVEREMRERYQNSCRELKINNTDEKEMKWADKEFWDDEREILDYEGHGWWDSNDSEEN